MSVHSHSAVYVVSTGLDTDVEGGVDEIEEVGVPEAGDVDAESRQRGWLESLPLPGVPKNEAQRRAAWRRVPQRVRVAIRRLHRQFNHPAPRTLQAILRAGGAAKEFIEEAKLVKCESCERTSPKPRSHPVGIGHGNYVFGDVVGVDMLRNHGFTEKEKSVLQHRRFRHEFPAARAPEGSHQRESRPAPGENVLRGIPTVARVGGSTALHHGGSGVA